MDIIWLASYPKSGNTWLASLIYNYVYGPLQSSGDVKKQILDIHDLAAQGLVLNENAPRGLICKTHFLFSAQHPHAHCTNAFIHLMRHPKDVLLSTLNFAKIEKINQHINEKAFAENFIANMGVPKWQQFGYGNWAEHTSNWQSQREHFPHLFLTYESMKEDPHGNLEKIANFLNLPVDQEKIRAAVEASSFKRMRKMEEDDRKNKSSDSMFLTEDINENTFFINKGLSGQTLAHLGEGLDEMFDEKFNEALSLFGYK